LLLRCYITRCCLHSVAELSFLRWSFVKADDNMDCSLSVRIISWKKRDYSLQLLLAWCAIGSTICHIRLFCNGNYRCESFYYSSVYAVILVSFRSEISNIIILYEQSTLIISDLCRDLQLSIELIFILNSNSYLSA